MHWQLASSPRRDTLSRCSAYVADLNLDLSDITGDCYRQGVDDFILL